MNSDHNFDKSDLVYWVRSHSLITSRLREGGRGPFSVTLYDREGEGSGQCVYTHGQKIISTVLLALVIYLLGLVVWFWFFIGRLSRVD